METLESHQRALLEEKKGDRIYQWALVYTAIYIAKAMAPQMWTESYSSVNLDPRMSLYFQEWRKKISNFLAAGIKIKPEGVNLSAKENYACLPEFWSGMTPSDQQQVVDVFGKYDNHYSVKLPRELNRSF